MTFRDFPSRPPVFYIIVHRTGLLYYEPVAQYHQGVAKGARCPLHAYYYDITVDSFHFSSYASDSKDRMEYNILEYIPVAGIIWVGFRPVHSSELGLGIVAFITESMERLHIWSLDLRRYYFIIQVIF